MKDPSLLGDALGERAGRFFRERLFPSAAKGFLVISGNLDPIDLKKVLCTYLGHLQPASSVSLQRPVKYVFAAGRRPLGTVNDAPARVRVRAECPYPLTGKTRYMTGAIEETVRRAAIRAAGPRARALKVRCHFDAYPDEHLVMELSFSLVDGHAEDVVSDILNALYGDDLLNDRDASAYKTMAFSDAEASFKTQEGIHALVVARYAGRKDFKTRYKENIQSITREDIAGAVQALARGTWASTSEKWEKGHSERSSR